MKNLSQEIPEKSNSVEWNKIVGISLAVGFFFFIVSLCGLLSSSFFSNPDQSNIQTKEVKSAESQRLPNILTYNVTRVIDGDTLEIDYEGGVERVRLIGIDTPEMSGSGGRECFAQEATDKLKSLTEGKKVSVEFDSTQNYRDKYGRLLLYIWLENEKDATKKGVFVNKIMISEGYAHEYTYDKPYEYQKEFKNAEQKAEQNSIGLWGDICSCKHDQETGRECIGCRKANVTYSNWDCSTYKKDVYDNSCTTGCYIAPAPKNSGSSGGTSGSGSTSSWTCDCSKTCSQISSCAEAQWQLNHCGCTARDGDHDGTACDSKCQ